MRDEKKETGIAGSGDQSAQLQSAESDFISQLITNGIFTAAEVNEFSEAIKKRMRYLLELLWHGDKYKPSMRDAKGKPYRINVDDYPSLRAAQSTISAKQITAYDFLFEKNHSRYQAYFLGAWGGAGGTDAPKATTGENLSRLSAVCSRNTRNTQASTGDVEIQQKKFC